MNSTAIRHALTAAIFLTVVSPSRAQTTDIKAGDIAVQAEVIADGLVHPWSFAFLPDGAILITERPGRIRILAGDALSEPLAGVPAVFASGQGGLLDIVAANDFEKSGAVFFTYAQPGDGGGGTAVARARLVRGDGTPRLEDVETIFSMSKKTRSGLQFGSRIVVAPDGSLFITIGDRGDMERAQDMRDSAGSVIHINLDGSVPAANPDPEGSSRLPEIWSKGHRNPQGAVWDPVTNGLLTVEHGARGGDEINRPEAGHNYGWPVITYGRDYSGAKIGIGTEAEGYEQPLYYWDPSIAPSGMAVYEGDMFREWQGDLLVGALKAQLVARLDRDAAGKIIGEERFFDGLFGRIRDIHVAPDGAIWLMTDADNGKIIRISRTE